MRFTGSTSKKMVENSGGDPTSASTSASTEPAPSTGTRKYISTKQLAELEKRVLGGGRVRRTRLLHQEGQHPHQPPRPVEDGKAGEPLHDLDSLLSYAARKAAEEEGVADIGRDRCS